MIQAEPIDTDSARTTSERGLRYARLGGSVLTVLLWALGVTALVRGTGSFELFKGAFFIVYGTVISLPFQRMPDVAWRASYGLLVGLSALFVFVMVAVVMFAYMAAAERGERLGVPGFEGTLIFLALLQVPVVLFRRKPDLLD